MKCPMCGRWTKVKDTRWQEARSSVMRRRECRKGHRFTTYETTDRPELVDIDAVDRDVADAVLSLTQQGGDLEETP